MATILVTGGAGGLGKEITPLLMAQGHTVRIMSRRLPPGDLDPRAQWSQADITDAHASLDAVVEGVDVMVNSMTSNTDTVAVDVDGTRRLLAAGLAAGLPHIVHISIVGIDRVATPYYSAKLAAEDVVVASGVPYTIWRATQFHTLLDAFLAPLRRTDTAPVLRFPDALYQLIDTSEAAQALLPHISSRPAGRLPGLGGPQVLTLDEIARQWLASQRIERPFRYVPGNQESAEELRSGALTAPENPFGTITWADYLGRTYAR